MATLKRQGKVKTCFRESGSCRLLIMAEKGAKDQNIVDLKPPNTKFSRQKPNINKPLSISAIESFKSDKSDDENSRLHDPSILKDTSSLKASLKRSKSRSLFQKRKLQRVVSKRFNTNKRVIKKALSQFLEDEEVS